MTEPFTVESNVLTPTMKIKRNVAKVYFEQEIKNLYKKTLSSSAHA